MLLDTSLVSNYLQYFFFHVVQCIDSILNILIIDNKKLWKCNIEINQTRSHLTMF